MRFGNLPRQNESDSRALRLCCEEWDEQIRATRQTWAFVLYDDRNCAVLACPSDTNIASRFQRRVDGVAQKVYKKLIELISVGANDRWRTALHAHRQSRLERGDASHPRRNIEWKTLRRG